MVKFLRLMVVVAGCCVALAASAETSGGTGTGFFITSSGYIATNFHVIANANQIGVKTSRDEYLKAELVTVDKANDLAILKVEGRNFIPLAIKSSSAVKKGAKVYTLGFPNASMQGMESKVTEGIVSSLSGLDDEPTRFQISVPLQPGNSGGPLMDMSGAVVGVTAAKLDAEFAVKHGSTIPENVNYAIKSNYLLELARTRATIGSKLVLANSDKPVSLPSLVERADRSVVFILALTVDQTPTVAKLTESPTQYTPELVQAYEQGKSAYDRKDFETAMRILRQAANRGHRAAMYYVGLMYYHAQGVNLDYPQAMQWFRQAGAQGDTKGQAMVCSMLVSGRGVVKDLYQAFYWCESAAGLGDPWAAFEMAMMYLEGNGTQADPQKSLAYGRHALELGYARAAIVIGQLYLEGKIPGTDPNQALRLLQELADKGDATAQLYLAVVYRDGRTGVPRDPVVATAWLRKAAQSGNANAQFLLGEAYANGSGVTIDRNEALVWYRKAAAQGHEQAQSKAQALAPTSGTGNGSGNRQPSVPLTPPAIPVNAMPQGSAAGAGAPSQSQSTGYMGDVIDVVPEYGYVVVRTSASVSEGTLVMINLGKRQLIGRAGRASGDKLSVSVKDSNLNTGLIGAPAYLLH